MKKLTVNNNEITPLGTCNCGVLCGARCVCSCSTYTAKVNNRLRKGTATYHAEDFRSPGETPYLK